MNILALLYYDDMTQAGGNETVNYHYRKECKSKFYKNNIEGLKTGA